VQGAELTLQELRDYYGLANKNDPFTYTTLHAFGYVVFA